MLGFLESPKQVKPDKAIDNLNKTINDREAMIDKILSHPDYRNLPDKEFYKKEKQLMNSGYITLKNKVKKLFP